MPIAKSSLFRAAEFSAQLAEAANPITVFKDTLSQTRSTLAAHYRAGASASDVVFALTWFMDELLKQAWKLHKNQLSVPDNDVALVAVGGYGRGELHPYSDIDIQLLMARDQYDQVREFTETFVRFLWDIGLDVGHSIRSIKDCVKEAKQDVTVMTNLLESRLLIGDPDLLQKMDERIRHTRVWPAEKFFAAKMAEQTDRHAAFNDTAYNLEPNIKEGPGGLRDLQMVLWVYNRSFGSRTYKDLKDFGFLQEKGIHNFVRNRNVLWKLRLDLHFLNNRREDRLLFDYQRVIAEQYGFKDNEKHLAVEQLMQRYYRTVKDIGLQNELLLERYRLEILQKKSRKPVAKTINKRFQVRDNTIEMVDDTVFSRAPYALLEIFLLMQMHSIDNIHPDTIRAIRYNLHLINKSFRKDIRCISLFIEIFRHNVNLTHTLRRMNNYGVLGAYIPAFGNIVGQMQHDLFHVYTVDAHTLMVIRNLRRLITHPDEFPLASSILGRLYKPERLYLGALFHDIAKGRGGDHSELGAVDAMNFCLHHKMSEYDAKLVAWLVEKHLYMSHFSQRRDISDPEVIREFVDIIGDQEHLDNLYLLTMADIRGTSPKVWNAWKGQLLKDLYMAARRMLRQGGTRPINLSEHIDDDKQLALQQLRETTVAIENVQHFWNTLDDDYFLRYTPDDIVWQITTIDQHSVLGMPIVSVRYTEHLEANQVFVFAPETNWLLSEVTGAFEQADLDIIEAKINSTNAGFGLYTFTCLVPEQELTNEPRYLQHLERELRNSMLFGQNNREFSRSFVSRALKHFPIKPTVAFINSSDNHTIMEVIAQNQPGLLHKVALCLLKCNVQLINARIATFGERAEDVFFIAMRDGSPVVSETILDELSSSICSVLNNQDVAEAG